VVLEKRRLWVVAVADYRWKHRKAMKTKRMAIVVQAVVVVEMK
jgi:hypothetical protein